MKLKKNYVVIKNNKITQYVFNLDIDLDPYTQNLIENEGYEYRLTNDPNPTDLKLQGHDLVVDAAKRGLRIAAEKRQNYPDTKDMVIALILNDVDKVQEYKDAIDLINLQV